MYHTAGVLFKNTFGTPEMRDIFSEERFIEHFLAVEAALARAEADAGLIPEAAAAEITEKATLDAVDLDDIESNVAEIHLFTMSIIDAWKDQVGDAGEYIHWGATSQDISDMAFLLQLREGYDVVRRDVDRIRERLADLAEDHASTPMIGRTHQVHAIPITFGLKAATWLDELNRHAERLDQLEDRVFAVEFFGATGTLASIGEPGLAVQDALAAELDLSRADAAWYVSRDRLVELMDVIAGIAGTLGRLASHVLTLNRDEIGEVEEPIESGKIGSSTMPHKRNPVKSEESLCLARLVDGHAGMMGELMRGADERDFSTWLPEFAIMPEAFLYSGRLLEHVQDVLAGLIVNEDRMRENLTHHGSLVTSEAVMMALADTVGRQTAHEIVHEHAMAAFEEGADFEALLRNDDRVMDALTAEELSTVTDPAEYTGLADRLARQVAARVTDH